MGYPTFSISKACLSSALTVRTKRAIKASEKQPISCHSSIYQVSNACQSRLRTRLHFAGLQHNLSTPSTLTSLDLTSVREAYLAGLLSVTQNLGTLRWAWYYDFGVDDQFTTPIIDLDKIAAAIAHVRDTLTDLTISADCAIGGNDQLLPGLKTEGSLHAMVNCDMLRRLQVPWPFLVGFAQNTTKRLQDMMPRNIEYLSITDDLRLQNDDNMVPEWPPWKWEDSAIVGLPSIMAGRLEKMHAPSPSHSTGTKVDT